ncbi:mannose-1-phosphate guanylyltransferase [Elizabethkingia anophelis]|uniref:mannose-1-phosphate guanylyltransferase n=3 Tax=Elizabethkingia anophelis TaxID=1117645 RepID=UPI000751A3C8|nr:mannose-1-phosphate guanylyltransferase [Elizabethkingia anophelis]AQW91216.1 mannose-1-phosphate guanylyltransferase [Elizabethkingia anophelis]KUY14082.1 mannose-1-phosphate guanylyltransferase [Elizabethkingia anophelis]MCT3726513.1 mannose-1-phosphate guanylyltransferase [Elizabethkingia anophelis]MCT4237380.1 mannose-1-phosphate guanylyltransferase [Elizabethkingia anophelis]MCT4318644.1 mannose-1-phosphate guanylyltransferase [Elizabethkingia anophelis]
MPSIINVILSGGVGSRLWPLSRKEKPKQYLDIFENGSLFQQTVLRNREYCDKLMVVGNQDNVGLSRKSLLKLNIEDYMEIIESMPRNTAAAIAFSAFKADVDDILLVTPSDHLIEDLELYHQSVMQAIHLAKENHIVTFGLKPTKPETGYGYIHIKNNKVLGFREKPNEDTAKEFLNTGHFYWNSGMFCFKAGVFLEQLELYEPEVYLKAKLAYDNINNSHLPLAESMDIPSISVDYAVMERTKKLQAVIGTFKWSDMGSFESVYEYLIEKGHHVDKYGNMVLGTKIHTEFLGIKKCILIFTDDAILILKKEKSQDVKKIYNNLEKSKSFLI